MSKLCSVSEDMDTCYLWFAEKDPQKKVPRYYTCDEKKNCDTRSYAVTDYTSYKRHKKKIFDKYFNIIGEFAQLYDENELLILANIESTIDSMFRSMFDTWHTHTTLRSLEEEQYIPLATLGILMLNRCAIRIVSCLVQYNEFVLVPAMVSICIGWSMCIKEKFQLTSDTKQYDNQNMQPYTELFDLMSSFKNLVRLVAMFRGTSEYTVDNTCICTTKNDKDWKDHVFSKDAKKIQKQVLVDRMVCVFSSGRLCPDAEKIADMYIIPKYNDNYGYLYPYFSTQNGKSNEMMCQASTTLILTILYAVYGATDGNIGAVSYPNHILPVLFKPDNTYVVIESTWFTAEQFGPIGMKYTIELSDVQKIKHKPYIYQPKSGIEASHILVASKNMKETQHIKSFRPLYPYNMKNRVRQCSFNIRSILKDIIVDYTNYKVTFVFQPDTINQTIFIDTYVTANYQLYIQSVTNTSAYTEVCFSRSNLSIFMFDSMVTFYHSLLSTQTTVRICSYNKPETAKTLREYLEMSLYNEMGAMIKVPSSGTLTLTNMEDLFQTFKTRNHSFQKIKALFKNLVTLLPTVKDIKTLKQLQEHSKEISIPLPIGIDTGIIYHIIGELNNFQNAVPAFQISFQDVRPDIRHIDMVHSYKLRSSNKLLNDSIMLSDVFKYEWYNCILHMGFNNIFLREIVDEFEAKHNIPHVAAILDISKYTDRFFPFFEPLDYHCVNVGNKRKQK